MKRARRRRTAKRALAVMVLVLLAVCTVYINKAIRPVAGALMITQGSIICSVEVNKALVEVLNSEQTQYSDLVQLLRDEQGNIVGISTNSAQVNRIKSQLTIKVNEVLEKLPENDIKIAVGTLSGIKWLSGRGPKITLKMTPSSYAESTIVNLFESGGINQTRHQIVIEFNVEMTAIMAAYRVPITVPVNICIAETIIVGAVPQMFADF